MTLTVVNPATEEPLAELEQACRAAARRGWSHAARARSRARRSSSPSRPSYRSKTLWTRSYVLEGYSEAKSVFISTEG